jgi:septal ring factor EnvC (AmiA/AmiB activator)
LTAFRDHRYDCGVRGGAPISVGRGKGYDFKRLERAVASLARAYGSAQEDKGELRRRVEEQNRQIRSLEGRLLEANQRRQDVAKRIDELVAQLDHLEGQLGQAER